MVAVAVEVVAVLMVVEAAGVTKDVGADGAASARAIVVDPQITWLRIVLSRPLTAGTRLDLISHSRPAASRSGPFRLGAYLFLRGVSPLLLYRVHP